MVSLAYVVENKTHWQLALYIQDAEPLGQRMLFNMRFRDKLVRAFAVFNISNEEKAALSKSYCMYT